MGHTYVFSFRGGFFHYTIQPNLLKVKNVTQFKMSGGGRGRRNLPEEEAERTENEGTPFHFWTLSVGCSPDLGSLCPGQSGQLRGLRVPAAFFFGRANGSDL